MCSKVFYIVLLKIKQRTTTVNPTQGLVAAAVAAAKLNERQSAKLTTIK
jgi:hypothetical protein